MDTVNVLVLAPVNKECLSQIQAISPQLRVVDAAGVLGISNPFEQFGSDSVLQEKLDALLRDADVLFTFRVLPDLSRRAPRLKWVQTLSAGVERVLTPDLVESPIILTNVRGMHAAQIGEIVFASILVQAKQSLTNWQNQQDKKWVHYTPALLAGQTLGIVGFGSIGRRVARLGKAFDMHVVAIRRSAPRTARAVNADTLYSQQELPRLLAESDFVVNALPSTPETFRYFGRREFSQMKPTAFFINIGRGATVDEEALVEVLKEHRLAGASLDTFVKEPLPADSPLWHMPGVIITPHIAGAVSDYSERATAIFCDNLARFVSGKRLKNIVNKRLGY